MSDYYARKPFPHEDDAAFERTLRNISTQEVMPRPVAHGTEFLSRNSYEEFFGDNWHWDELNVPSLLALALRFGIAVAWTTVGGAMVLWIIQPLTKPMTFLWREMRGIVRYTFLMQPVVPERYDRYGTARIRRWMTGPFFQRSFKQTLRLWYNVYTKRVPVFVFGTWLASKLVWAIEDMYGQDALVKQRTPVIIAGGFVALGISLSRNNVINFVRAPVYAFGGAFAALFVIDTLFVGKEGFDSLLNPLHLHLPAPAVSFLTGAPFNGEIIFGPIKYFSLNLANAVTSHLFEIGHLTRQFVSRVSDSSSTPPSSTQDALSSYTTSIDRKILALEEQALEQQGFFVEPSSDTLERRSKFAQSRAELNDSYDKSPLNIMRYFGAPDGTRLSTNTLHLVSHLFGDSRLSSVTTPLHGARPTQEIIFGNLTGGIQLAASSAHVEKVRSQLQQNASAQQPQLLGPASEMGFFRREQIKAKHHTEAALIDPVGFLLKPLVALVTKLPEMHLFKSFYAFDDYSNKVSHAPLWDDRNSKSRSSTSPQSTPTAFSAPTFDPSLLGEDDLPGAYDVPPLIPQEAVERQKQRILNSKPFSVDESNETITDFMANELPMAMEHSADAIVRGAVDAKEILTDAGTLLSTTLFPQQQDSMTENELQMENERPTGVTMKDFLYPVDRSEFAEVLAGKYVPDDEYFRMIKASVDETAKEDLPEGITAEERLMNFVENIGGRDFEEPSYVVKRFKSARNRWRMARLQQVPIVGERQRNVWRALSADLHKAISVRVDYLSRAMSSDEAVRSTTFGYKPAEETQRTSEALRQSIEDTQRIRTSSAERLDRMFITPAKNWFNEMKERLSSSMGGK